MKIVIKGVYITGGLVIFALYLSNGYALIANTNYKLKLKQEITQQEVIDCMNCDEID